MSRRYLTLQEAESALSRGKTVELFVGPFTNGSDKCIRWASFTKKSAGVVGYLWEAYDQGSSEFLDIYSFSSPSGEYDEPIKTVMAASIETAAVSLAINSVKFVNQGVVQDEYADFLASSI